MALIKISHPLRQKTVAARQAEAVTPWLKTNPITIHAWEARDAVFQLHQPQSLASVQSGPRHCAETDAVSNTALGDSSTAAISQNLPNPSGAGAQKEGGTDLA